MNRLPVAVWVSGSWVVATAVAVVLVPGRPALGAAALMGGLGALAAGLLVRPLLLPLAVGAALLGVARVDLAGGAANLQPTAQRVAGATVRLDGTVADDPRDVAAGYELLVQPRAAVTLGGARLPPFGDVLVTAKGPRRAGYGDEVEVDGKLALPAESAGFDRRAYLATRGAWLEMRVQSVSLLRTAGGPFRLVGAIRDTYRLAVDRMLPPPHAAVLEGVVLGIRSGIPPPLQQALISTGLIHLLVLRG